MTYSSIQPTIRRKGTCCQSVDRDTRCSIRKHKVGFLNGARGQERRSTTPGIPARFAAERVIGNQRMHLYQKVRVLRSVPGETAKGTRSQTTCRPLPRSRVVIMLTAPDERDTTRYTPGDPVVPDTHPPTNEALKPIAECEDTILLPSLTSPGCYRMPLSIYRAQNSCIVCSSTRRTCAPPNRHTFPLFLLPSGGSHAAKLPRLLRFLQKKKTFDQYY